MAEFEAFGTTHVDRPSKVAEELSEFADDADVLFIESPRSDADDSHEYNMLIRNPALYLTAIILEAVWGIIGFILTRQFDPVDRVVTKKVAREMGVDVEPVDLDIPREMSEVHPIITVLSWLWIVLIGFVFVLGVFASSIVVLAFALGLGFLPILPFSQLTLSDRDEVMAENIQQILSTNDDVSKGCLIAGQDHLNGVEEELEASDIQVSQTFKSKWLRRSL
jgi:hypothetical protein